MLTQVAAQTLQLPDGSGDFVQATCIVAKETAPSAGDKLKNLPVENLEQAARMR